MSSDLENASICMYTYLYTYKYSGAGTFSISLSLVMSDSAFNQSLSSTSNMDLQQTHVSPSRLADEVVILLECTNITSEHSKEIQQEIKESPFENTISNILTELFKERESLPCNLVETARDSTRVVDMIQKLDNKLKLENIICTDAEDTDFAHLDDKDISSSTLHEYKTKISQIKQVRLLSQICLQVNLYFSTGLRHTTAHTDFFKR